MVIRRIKYKILAVVGVSVAAVLFGFAYYFTLLEERAVLEQNERTVHRLTESVIQGLQSVMLSGYAHIALRYAEHLKTVDDVKDFRILRTDGTEAYRDNRTIESVNRRRGEDLFVPREVEERNQVLAANDPNLAKIAAGDGSALTSYYESDERGRRYLTFLDTIPNAPVCHKCHGAVGGLRGVVKFTTSMEAVENDILKTRQQIFVGAAAAIALMLLLTGYMMGRSVVAPIERVTDAMAKAAGGDLDQKVPAVTHDELGQMAKNFNVMTAELKSSYNGLKIEQDKLATIIQSAGEGIVVTDPGGKVVLVNPAAERLLGKSAESIARNGFANLLDDPGSMLAWLSSPNGIFRGVVVYKERNIEVSATTIHRKDGHTVGSAALMRDVTEQLRLEEELQRQAVTDGLTGLYNRRFLDRSLQSEYSRAVRYNSPLSVLLLDADHFKRVNDAHGHEKGDQVLKAIAQIMKAALRINDLPCRYGGEEFLAILPESLPEGAHAVAERIRTVVEQSEIAGIRVTVSVGVASFPEVGYGSAEALVQAADQALYGAKSSGRNRVQVAMPESAQVRRKFGAA
ncbi:MAG: diguanylate cyclase [Betaproteobacteria bacterium]|nr:diguanylate cyclase [Betaproteobacteria bacterium]